MSTEMTSTVTKNRVIGIMNHKLCNKEFIDQLKNVYYKFLMSNYGPSSGLVAIQNSAGRYVYSSSSAVVLENLQFFHPVHKFMNAFINAQNKLYGTHGLYVGLLCSGLLFRFLQLEEEYTSFRLRKELSDWIINQLLQELQVSHSKMILNIELCNVDHILCIVKSVLNSKVYNILLKEETDHLCLKIMQCFVKSIPHEMQKDFSNLHFSTIEGSTTMNSQIYEGVLYRETDFLLDDLQDILNKPTLPKNNFKIVIFNVPLSSDQSEASLVKWCGKIPIGYDYDMYLVNELKHILIEKGIHIIASQKYIDATIKFELEKAGYLVLDRLGTRLSSSLTLMCKCHPVTMLSDIEQSENIGCVYEIKAVEIAGKTFLHLMSENSSECLTFILAGLNSHIVEYLKEVVGSCVTILQHSIIKEPLVVFGAGCHEAFIVMKLLEVKQMHFVDLLKKFDSPSAHINKVFEVFIETFLQLSIQPSGGDSKNLIDYYVDSSFNHLWMIDEFDFEALETPFDQLSAQRLSQPLRKSIVCTCKSVTLSELPDDTYFTSLPSFKNHVSFTSLSLSENANTKITPFCIPEERKRSLFKKESIVDYWAAKLNSLRLAFDCFSELLQIEYCIFDK